MTCPIHHCPKLGKNGTRCKLCNNLSSRWSVHHNLDGYKVKEFETIYYPHLPAHLKGSSVEEAHALILQEYASIQDAGPSKRKSPFLVAEGNSSAPRLGNAVVPKKVCPGLSCTQSKLLHDDLMTSSAGSSVVYVHTHKL